MISQTKNRSQVSSGRLSISTRQQTIEIPGSSGTSGTRKPRLRSGCFLRSTITPAETRMNANSVPIFDRSANQLMSKMPAGNADHEARHPGADVRRLVARMHAREDVGQQAVARHREPDARLPVLEHQQRRQHAEQRAGGDDQPQPVHAERLQRVGHRRVVVQRVPIGDAGQHQRDRAIEQRADRAASAKIPDRHIALRASAFLGRGRDRIESDVSEEDDGAAR